MFVVVSLPDPFLGIGVQIQLCRVPIIGRLSTDGTRSSEEKGYGRICPGTDGSVQDSLARDEKSPVI